MKNKIQCPACGSSKIYTKIGKRSYKPLFGKSVEYKITINTCEECFESGDFLCADDEQITKTIQDANKASVPIMLDYLEDCGCSSVYIERVLDLPFGSLRAWRDGNCTPGEIALLMTIAFHPQVLDDITLARKKKTDYVF